MSAALPRAVRVLICTNSPTFTTALTKALEHGDDCHVVGSFTQAPDALAAMVTLQPNLVVMDFELPDMSGLEAIEQLMAHHPVPILVISSSERAGASALAAGALEVLTKDSLGLLDPGDERAAELRDQVASLSRARVISHPRAKMRTDAKTSTEGRAVAAIGICASTGGPLALLDVLASLPAEYPVPIYVVQHMSPGFLAGFAERLDAQLAIDVRVATTSAHAGPGVWLAPEDAHLVAPRNGYITLDTTTVDGYHRPSADMLFRSLAERFGTQAMGVVLTGMGYDGALGIAAIHEAGGITIAQDEATSAIFGMPRAAIEHGAQLVLAPEQIAAELASLSLAKVGST